MNLRVAVTAIAGWLFADLLLAFAIVVLGTQDPPPRPVAQPSPPPRQALERGFVKVTLSVDPDDARAGRQGAVEALRRAIQAKPRLRGRKAGIVLTFGAQNNGGEAFARDVNHLLERADGTLFANVATRDFQLLGASGGEVMLNIYLFYKN
ncbi:hypothetical protein ACFOY4_19755 [Actinomadura syzygii]|uniref:Uncharacterized protein n=1 Tax=Actinomadura syzygii TaxID=1427538 RepID=A0A5D0U382_9ACTN|nr:hypothetical protein [Actinomadura syzygii]TYC12394.1 hypothetical protein FXF65_24400 [Actinomadura syzygii]